MILASIILLAITLLVIFYPLMMSKNRQENTLQDIYKKNYIATEKKLARHLQSGTLSQADYDTQHAEAARDLLKMTRKGQGKLSSSARILVVVLALLFPFLAIGGFWTISYTPNQRIYDSERERLITEFTTWRDTIPKQQLESLNNILMITPQPRDPEILNQLKYGFPALFYMSAKENHNNLQTLRLLGKILYDVRWYPAAHEVYARLADISPTDYIANAMLIDMEMQNSKTGITPELESKLDRFFALYPNDTAFRVMYAQALYEDQKVDQSIAQWRILRGLYAKNTDDSKQAQVQQTLQAIDMILASIEQHKMETSQIRNFDITMNTFGALDWDILSKPSILTLYMMDMEHNTPVAFKEQFISPDTQFPLQLDLNDFDRFEDVNQPIRDFEHLAIFGEISTTQNSDGVYATDLTTIAKGAYEADITFAPITEVNPFTNPMMDTIKLTDGYKAHRFLVEVEAPDIDIKALPESATLNLFISPAGSRMPLAAKSLRFAKNLTFPLTVEITDANKLMEGTPSLFTYNKLEVGARLSMTTEAVGQAGDIESAKHAISKDDRTAVLILDQVRDTTKASPIASE